jgi:hypothetical protein
MPVWLVGTFKNKAATFGTRRLNQGEKEWPNLKKCFSARQLIVVVYMIRTVETAKAKLPKEHNLKKHRKTGNVPYAEPVKNVSVL